MIWYLKILFESQSQYLNFDLSLLVANRLTPDPFSIGSADWYLAKGSHFLTEEENNYQIQVPAKTLTVQDTHLFFYCIKEIPERYHHYHSDWNWVTQVHPRGIPHLFCSLRSLWKWSWISIHISDSDVFYIPIFYVSGLSNSTVLLDTGVGNQKNIDR